MFVGDNTNKGDEKCRLATKFKQLQLMRLLDFFVFSMTSYYKDKRRGNLFWNSPIRRAGFIIGLIITLWLSGIMELALYFIGHIDILDTPQLMGFSIVLFGMLSSQMIKKIYVTNERYALITSSSYRPFELNNNRGVTICILILALGFILIFGSALIINHLDPLKS